MRELLICSETLFPAEQAGSENTVIQYLESGCTNANNYKGSISCCIRFPVISHLFVQNNLQRPNQKTALQSQPGLCREWPSVRTAVMFWDVWGAFHSNIFNCSAHSRFKKAVGICINKIFSRLNIKLMLGFEFQAVEETIMRPGGTTQREKIWLCSLMG